MSSVKEFLFPVKILLCLTSVTYCLDLNCYIIILVVILMTTELSVQSRFAHPNSFPLLPHFKVFTFHCMAMCFRGDCFYSQSWGASSHLSKPIRVPSPPPQRLLSEWLPVPIQLIVCEERWAEGLIGRYWRDSLLFSWQLFYLDEMPDEVVPISAIFAEGRKPETGNLLKVAEWNEEAAWSTTNCFLFFFTMNCWTDMSIVVGIVNFWSSC